LRKLKRTYFPFLRATIQEILAYPGEALLYIFGMTIGMFVVYYIWKVIYTSGTANVIEGFTFNEMIVYIILSFGVMQAINNGTVWNIAHDIREGTIIMNMIKPINYHLRLLFQELGFVVFICFIVIFPFSLIALVLKLTNVTNVILFLLSLFMGILVGFLFDFIFGMMAFYIKNIFGIGFGKTALVRLLSGGLIPLVFFPDSVQKIIDVLPFKAMVFTPIMIFLGKYSGQELIYVFLNQVLWIIILIGINYIVWQRAVKHITVQGG